MRRSKLSGVGIPGLSTGDGNCLFNAVSTVLTGDEELAPELRLRTAIEMALNTDKYKKRGDYNDLMACSPSYEESLLAACTDGAYMSVWNMIVLSTVVGKPIQSVYPALNGDKDKTLGYLNKLFKTNENQNRETITVLWSRLGPCRRPSWTPNHFVPILPHSSQQPSKPKTSIITSNEQPSVTSTPKHDPKQPQTTTKVEPEDNITPKAETTLPQNVTIIPMSSPKQVISDLPTATIMGNDGTPFRITQITNILPANDTTMNMELEQSSIACENEVHDDTDERDESTQYDDTEFVVNPPSENMPVQPDSLDNQTNLVTSSNNDDDDESPENMTVDNSEHQHLPDLPVPPTAKPFRQGRWHTADELYSIITNTTDVNEEVPPGDKSNCYMVVNNERNMTKLSSGKNKKCDFYDDCGAWDYTKGNTCKTTYVVTDGSLRHVELKNSQYSTKVRRQGKVHWVPLDPQPADENVVTISRYYATSTTDPNFEKKVSYFVRKTDASLGNIAVYEWYEGNLSY